MSGLSSSVSPLSRPGGHPWGLHRVVSPVGALPQAAKCLEASLPIYDNEMMIEVERLNIDSASFQNLKKRNNHDPKKIAQEIQEIVGKRGKMQNPTTGSGGMLLGKVFQLGSKFPSGFKVGQGVATLVSLTLTPLVLEKIKKVHLDSAQVEVSGRAILFESGVAAPIPEDLPEDLSLATLDVCGAPAWVKRLIQPQHRVLLLGLGKAGLLSAAAAREVIGSHQLFVVDKSAIALQAPSLFGEGTGFLQGDTQKPGPLMEALEKLGRVDFDLVVNTCNVPETEVASILACRPGGKVLFFNMATNFSRAVLSAEGLGRDVQLIMGNGYALGHWEYALNLVRRHQELRRYLS